MATNLPESFQLIFHDSPLGVAVVLNTHGPLEEGLLLYANPSLLKLFEQWQPSRFDLTNVIAQLCTNEEGDTLLPLPIDSHDQRALVSKIILSDGTPRWVEVRAQPTTILNERGHFFWINDVT